MANKNHWLSLSLAICLGSGAPALAQRENQSPPGIRADYIRSFPDAMIADMPGGHWATHATQVAVANNVLQLEEDLFKGERALTTRELHGALQALASTAENIAGKGILRDLRGAVESVPQTDQLVNRIALAQTFARFLDAANQNGLLALGEPTTAASRFRDMGATVPPAIISVVDTYKVMTGFRDMTFRPNEIVNRYQLAAVATQILDDMRQAPLAQQPVEAPPTVVVVPEPVEPEPEAEPEPAAPRDNFRANARVVLAWQALNYGNLLSDPASLSTIPVSGMFTTYAGPVMFQGVSNFRYDMYTNNLFDTELRVGYSDLKWGMLQLIPYVGTNLGVGTAIPGQTEFSTYLGATYGGILSLTPVNNVEIWGSLGQSALMGAGRFNSAFQPLAYLGTAGTLLTNYGVGLDLYLTPNLALTLGLNNFQLPSDLYVAPTAFSGGVLDTLGGNVGLGFSF
ncbi:MAG: hypothetical protein VKN33_04745 [Candidatus Sericytochromatia bacterium]|nr:hypothetical protein [Candidatus Sericytochromatia bacterium]